MVPSQIHNNKLGEAAEKFENEINKDKMNVNVNNDETSSKLEYLSNLSKNLTSQAKYSLTMAH